MVSIPTYWTTENLCTNFQFLGKNASLWTCPYTTPVLPWWIARQLDSLSPASPPHPGHHTSPLLPGQHSCPPLPPPQFCPPNLRPSPLLSCTHSFAYLDISSLDNTLVVVYLYISISLCVYPYITLRISLSPPQIIYQSGHLPPTSPLESPPCPPLLFCCPGWWETKRYFHSPSRKPSGGSKGQHINIWY